MAFKQTRPFRMKGPLKRSGLLKIGRSMKQSSIDNQISEGELQAGETGSGVFYNSKMGPMKMVSPSALKQAEETTMAKEDILALEGEVEGGGEGGGKNIDLLPSELEGTWVYPGTDLSERIFDYEDRIEFLTTDSEEDPTNTQIQKDLATLNTELEALYTERDASDQEGNITPEYDDQGQRIK